MTADLGTIGTLRNQIRVLLILEAAERADLTPLSLNALHSFAYLSNVLSPIWGLSPFEGTVYKSDAAPYYPALQQSIDDLVGRGLLVVSNVEYRRGADGRWRFAGSFRLNRSLAGAAVEEAIRQPELSEVFGFLREMAFALSASDPDTFDNIAMQDANYADPRSSVENVVDFAEWSRQNSSASAARSFEHLVPGSILASRGEQLNLYIRHLGRLLPHARSS